MGALRHVVMWTLHDSVDAARFKATLDSCRHLVAGIEEFEVGIRQTGLDASCDVVLVSTFADRASLDAYQAHPHHQRVSAQLGPLRSVRMVLDYDIEAARASAARVPTPVVDPSVDP
jgi:quinol monooxygenase YgiN